MSTLIERYLTGQAPARPLALVRIIIGLSAAASALELIVLLPQIFAPAHLQMPFVSWIPRLPAPLAIIFAALWATSALLLALGLHTRAAGATLAALVAYALLCDQQLYSNHYYLLLLLTLLLTISDSGADLSLDARRAGARQSVVGWPVLLIKLQLSAVYFFAAVTKLNPVFMSGEVIRRYAEGGLILPLPPAWLALLAVATELFLAFGLWLPGLRWAALVAGLALHTLIVITMGLPNAHAAFQLTQFGAITLAPYLLFFAPRRPGARGSPHLAINVFPHP
jgi:hypothetical protein